MKYLIVLTAIIILILSCAKEKAAFSGLSDENLFNYIKDTNGRVYYQNGNTLAAAGGSPHGSFKMWFNTKAFPSLNAQLEIPSGQQFPDSSLIVKEVVSGQQIVLYAIMFKYKGTWLWAEYGTTGNIVHGLGEGSALCLSCHNQSPNRDNVLSFDLH